MIGRLLAAFILACAFSFVALGYLNFKPESKRITIVLSTVTRATEPLEPLQKDHPYIVPKKNEKHFAKVLGFVVKQVQGSCDRRPQSPAFTGLDIQDTCGMKLKEQFAKVTKSVTQTVKPNPDGTVNWATAFKYCHKPTQCYYITNEHVADDVTEIGLVTEDGQNVAYGQVIHLDKVNDLAIISVPPGDTRPSVKLGKTAKVGDRVFAVGHPLGMPYQIVTPGLIIETNATITPDMGTYHDVTHMSIVVTMGSSGSPTFNENGELVGVVSNKSNRGSVSVPISKVLDLFAKKNNKEYAP